MHKHRNSSAGENFIKLYSCKFSFAQKSGFTKNRKQQWMHKGGGTNVFEVCDGVASCVVTNVWCVAKTEKHR